MIAEYHALLLDTNKSRLPPQYVGTGHELQEE
jgi:hypothetical protein